MHVAVAGVEHIGHVQPVVLGQFTDPAQHAGQFGHRDRAVQTHVIVDLPHRPEGRLSAQPDAPGLVGIARFAQFHRVVAPRDLLDQAQLFVDLGGASLDLDDQQRLAIGIPRLGESLAGADARAVHEFDGHGQDTGLDDVADHLPRHLVAVIAHQHRARALGLGQDAQRGLGDDAQLSLGSADQAQQVQPAGIHMRATDFDNGAVHQHHGHAQQVVGRHAIFQAMRATRIHRDIPGDGAGQLAGRIGRVEKAIGFHGTGDRQVGAPGLNADESVVIVGFQHVAQPRHPQDHAVGGGQRPARKAGARTPRHHRHTFFVADLQRRRDLGCGSGQHRCQGRAAIGRQPVAFIGAGFVGVIDHGIGGQNGAQARDDAGAVRQNYRVRRRHLHGKPPSLVRKYNQLCPNVQF